jgi:hypothetical protein
MIQIPNKIKVGGLTYTVNETEHISFGSDYNKVLDDMANGDGLISEAAMDYYIEHYATPAEVERMRRNDLRDLIVARLIISAVLIGLGVCGFWMSG